MFVVADFSGRWSVLSVDLVQQVGVSGVVVLSCIAVAELVNFIPIEKIIIKFLIPAF